MTRYYRVFWASVISGTLFGILYGIYSLQAQNKYLANCLYNLASLQFLQSFDTIVISLVVLGILTGIVIKYEKRIQFMIRGSRKLFAVFVGAALLLGLALIRIMQIDIPLLQIQKDALLFKLPYGMLFVLLGLLLFLLILRYAHGMVWPQQRMIFLFSSLVMVGINLAVLSTVFLNKMSAAKKPNLVIISIDTIRADHLSCYGYHRNTSPAIDRFAEESIRFHRAVVPMSTTLPSHSSLLTGDNPVTHGVKMNGMKFSSKNLTLTEVLKNEGYNTAAMVGAVILKKEMGLTLGFDAYDDEMPGRLTRTAEEVRKSAEEWLDRNKNSGFFTLLHFYDTHDPYTPSAPFDTLFHSSPEELADIYRPTKANHLHLRKHYPEFSDQTLPSLIQKEIDNYDGEIRYVDNEIDKFFNYLKSNGLWDDTIVIVTGDHGESLGERGLWGHSNVYEEEILVPFLIKLPHGQTTKRTIYETVRLIDITPTIFEMLNVKNPKRFDGKSLAEFKDGNEKSPSRITFLERRDVPDDMRLKYPDEYGKGKEYAIRTDEWKFIFKEAGENELYNLREDPLEVNNLITAEPDLATSLEDSVYTWLAGTVGEGQATKSNLDPETLKQLKSLGYIR